MFRLDWSNGGVFREFFFEEGLFKLRLTMSERVGVSTFLVEGVVCVKILSWESVFSLFYLFLNRRFVVIKDDFFSVWVVRSEAVIVVLFVTEKKELVLMFVSREMVK